MRLFLAVFCVTISCAAQPLTLGVKGGLRLTGDLNGNGNSESRPYLVGPMVEVHLPLHLAFEFDALYHRFGLSETTSGSFGSFTTRARANSWEFPLVLKYRLTAPAVHPYLAFGYAPRKTEGATQNLSGTYLVGNPIVQVPFAFGGTTSFPNDHAWLAGGGVEWHCGQLRIMPEVRYLRWNANRIYSVYGGLDLSRSQNEVQLLVGIGWGLAQ